MAIASNKKSADQRNGAARGKAAGKPSGRKAPAAATGKRSAPRSDDGEGPERPGVGRLEETTRWASWCKRFAA